MTVIKTYVDSSQGVISFLTNSLDSSLFEIRGTISASNYLGIPTGSATDIAGYSTTRIMHEPAMTPDRIARQPGQGPTVIIDNTLVSLAFTPNDSTDRAYRIFKIPSSYVASASFHAHWTKSDNLDESGKNVRWRVVYTIFNGNSESATATSSSLEMEDTYEDSGTTGRIVYRTSDYYLTGFQPGYYCSMYTEAITTVSGAAMTSEPALVSLDFLYLGTINQ